MKTIGSFIAAASALALVCVAALGAALCVVGHVAYMPIAQLIGGAMVVVACGGFALLIMAAVGGYALTGLMAVIQWASSERPSRRRR